MEANKKKIAYEAERIAGQRAAEKSAAETEAARLADVHLTFAVKVGEEDKLYGSVTAGDGQRKLEELGVHVGKRKKGLPQPIRELGGFPVGLKNHPHGRPAGPGGPPPPPGDGAGGGRQRARRPRQLRDAAPPVPARPRGGPRRPPHRERP